MEQAGFTHYRDELFIRTLSPPSASSSFGGHNQLWIRVIPFVQPRF